MDIDPPRVGFEQMTNPATETVNRKRRLFSIFFAGAVQRGGQSKAAEGVNRIACRPGFCDKDFHKSIENSRLERASTR
jgi:hypothetical protein